VTAPVKSVAVLGTGIMGAAIARNLAGAGLETRAWNRSREKAEPLAEHGVAVASTAAEAADGAGAVITMLADADAVLGVMTEGRAIEAMSSDSVWLQMSTIGINGTDDAMGLASRTHVRFVDSPVLGTKKPAEEGKLVILASGSNTDLDACAPVFDPIGSKVVRLGEAGGGTRMKLVVNAWLLALTTALAETFALADSLDTDPARFLEAIDSGPVGVPYAQLKGKAMIERNYETSFPLRLAAKDARLVLEAAEGVDLPLAQVVERRFGEAEEMGLGDSDTAAVYEATSARDDARPAATA
jgi:3-hydroxyisobutyrate dehydrogenase